MSLDGPEMDEWAALWREEEPSAQDRSVLQRRARRVAWRSTIFQHADVVLAMVLAFCIVAALATRLQPATAAVGVLSAAGLIWSSRKRHRLSQAALLIEIRDRTLVLDHEIGRIEAEHGRATLGVWMTPPLILTGALLTFLLRHDGGFAGFRTMLIESMTSLPAGPAVTAGMLALIYHQVLNAQKLKQQLVQLRAIRGEYRAEGRLDGTVPG